MTTLVVGIHLSLHMNFLSILHQSEDQTDIFVYLKQKFASDLTKISVETVVPDQLLHISWDNLISAADVAAEMTEELPNIIIETPSTTGIETRSRFFNKSQLF